MMRCPPWPQAKPLGDHRIASAKFTASTALIACSCGMSVTHTGADRRRIVDRFHAHRQAARDAEAEAVRRANGRVPTPAAGQGGGGEVRKIEKLAGPAGLRGLPSRRARRTTASQRRRTR